MNLIKRNFGLDLMRCFAISFVLLAHFASKLESIGFWGVELFFSLSGFLIGKILWQNLIFSSEYSWKQIGRFWNRRWWRTLPNYFLFLLMMVIFKWTRNGEFPLDVFIKSLLFLQNFLNREVEFFSVSWSLCIEEWFYLIFPIILFLFNKLKLSKENVFVYANLLIILFSFLSRFYFISTGVGHNLRGITLARLDAISYGVLISFYAMKYSGNKTFLKICGIIGSLLLVFCIYLLYFSNISYEVLRSGQGILFIAPLAFACILPIIEKFKSPISNNRMIGQFVLNISLWSYSIYLCHIPVMFITYELLANYRETMEGNLASKIIGLIFTILISAFIFRMFENPLTSRRKPNL